MAVSRVVVHISRSEHRVLDPEDVYHLRARGGETEVRLRSRTPLVDVRPIGEVAPLFEPTGSGRPSRTWTSMPPPISLERVQWSGEGEVIYQPKGGHDGRARQAGDAAKVFDPAEFLARVIMHIPEPRRHLVRYYGAYSNVARAGSRRLCRVCSSRRLRGPGLGLESPVPGQSSEFGGAYRFERPIDACERAPGLENTPRHRVSLESNERIFLFQNDGPGTYYGTELDQAAWLPDSKPSEKIREGVTKTLKLAPSGMGVWSWLKIAQLVPVYQTPSS